MGGGELEVCSVPWPCRHEKFLDLCERDAKVFAFEKYTAGERRLWDVLLQSLLYHATAGELSLLKNIMQDLGPLHAAFLRQSCLASIL